MAVVALGRTILPHRRLGVLRRLSGYRHPTLLAQVAAKAAAIGDSLITIDGVDTSPGTIPSQEEDRLGYRTQLVIENLDTSNQLGFGQVHMPAGMLSTLPTGSSPMQNELPRHRPLRHQRVP